MRVLVTRPASDANATADTLRDLGHEALFAAVLRIDFKAFTLSQPMPQALVLTSLNGVRAAASLLDGPQGHAWAMCRVYTVGTRTGEHARKVGFRDVIAPAVAGGVDALVAEICVRARRDAGRLVYVSGRDTTGDLAGKLTRSGFAVERCIGYAAERVTDWPDDVTAALKSGDVDAVLLYSARSAAVFLQIVAPYLDALAKTATRFLCLSPAVAAMMSGKLDDTRIKVAKSPDESALLQLLDTLHGD